MIYSIICCVAVTCSPCKPTRNLLHPWLSNYNQSKYVIEQLFVTFTEAS